MEMAFEFSYKSGLCAQDDVTQMQAHLSALDMPRLSAVPHLLTQPDALLSHMDQDKKNEGGKLALILARGIGDAFVEKQADRAAVGDYLHELAVKAEAS